MSEVAKATLTIDAAGVRTKVDLEPGTDPRALLVFAHDCLLAAEQKGCLSQPVVLLRLALQQELKDAGLNRAIGGGNGRLFV